MRQHGGSCSRADWRFELGRRAQALLGVALAELCAAILAGRGVRAGVVWRWMQPCLLHGRAVLYGLLGGGCMQNDYSMRELTDLPHLWARRPACRSVNSGAADCQQSMRRCRDR
jgi:hypothetical protein